MSFAIMFGLLAIGLFSAAALWHRDNRKSTMLIAAGVIAVAAQLLANNLPWSEVEMPTVAVLFAAGVGIGGLLSQFYPANGKA